MFNKRFIKSEHYFNLIFILDYGVHAYKRLCINVYKCLCINVYKCLYLLLKRL